MAGEVPRESRGPGDKSCGRKVLGDVAAAVSPGDREGLVGAYPHRNPPPPGWLADSPGFRCYPPMPSLTEAERGRWLLAENRGHLRPRQRGNSRAGAPRGWLRRYSDKALSPGEQSSLGWCRQGVKECRLECPAIHGEAQIRLLHPHWRDAGIMPAYRGYYGPPKVRCGGTCHS